MTCSIYSLPWCWWHTWALLKMPWIQPLLKASLAAAFPPLLMTLSNKIKKLPLVSPTWMIGFVWASATEILVQDIGHQGAFHIQCPSGHKDKWLGSQCWPSWILGQLTVSCSQASSLSRALPCLVPNLCRYPVPLIQCTWWLCAADVFPNLPICLFHT